MASNLGRIAHLKTLLDWMGEHLPVNVDVPIDRKDISFQSGVQQDYVNKSILVLGAKGYILFSRRRNTPSIHRVLKSLSDIKPEALHAWISAYQLAHDQDRRNADKAQQSPVESNDIFASTPTSGLATDQNVTRFESTFKTNGYRFEGSSTEPAPEAPKSRSQQLLDEAKRLQQLAEEELQREAMEQKQATSSADEQPGTLPELLMMLDNRMDGVERKFDALERKVNTVLYFFQQASFAVRGLAPVSLPVGPVSEPAPTAETTPVEPTTRMLLVRLVNSYAAADRKSEHDTWKWLYGQFDLRKGFNVYAQAGPAAKGKDESYLALIEQHGHIEELYKLARKLMVLPELK